MPLFQNTKATLLFIVVLVLGSLWVMFKQPPTLGLDLSGGTRLTLQAQPAEGATTVSPKAMDALQRVIQSRVDQIGVAETLVQRVGEKRLLVEIPGEFDPENAKARIGKTGLLEFKTIDTSVTPKAGAAVQWQSSGVSGRDLVSADVAPDNANGWVVSFQLNDAGKAKFRDLTRQLVIKHEPLGIFFDGKEVSAPSVQSAIPNGAGQISGNFKYEEAKEMVDILNAGALPLDIDFLEETSVGPLLGDASIRASFSAGLVGLGLVLVFMIAYYRMQGAVASIALIIYTLLTYAAYSLLDVTFTLAGIAGFILSIGMAVDANILIFERTKEELALGRSMLKAIDVGFDRAFSSIFDSNTTTIITCILLYMLGTGSVKGFAITLAIGVVISMFSAITVTRTFLHLLMDGSTSGVRPTSGLTSTTA